MSGGSWHERSGLPLACRKGHLWEPGQVTISWAPCDCPAALAGPGRGHLVVHCREAGCAETWQTDAGTLISALEEGNRGPGADHDGADTVFALGGVWTLLLHAQEHQMVLLKPSHASAARIAGLRSWIQDCVKAVDRAQRLGSLILRGEEVAQVAEIAERIAAVVDAFHMYASMLETFRNANRVTALGLSPRSEPLAAVADAERVLLDCRAALRGSMQQLIAAARADR